MKVVVLADTHVRDAGGLRLGEAAWAHVRSADVVLHAGDVVEPGLLDELRAVVPVHAVLGNNDDALRGVLPETVLVELDGVTVGMVHDSGAKAGRAGRMRRRFPTADVVVFGHSHIPWNEEGFDGQLLFNPGSATQRRSQPHRTLGVLELAGGRIRRHDVVTLD